MEVTPKILVIGGEGYIGSALIDNLEQKENIVVWDAESYTNTSIQSFDVVINLAAHSSVDLCQLYPVESHLNNVSRLGYLIDNLKPSSYLIHASSASVYGSYPGIANEETPLLKALTLYDEQKILGEKLINQGIKQGKKLAALRFGTLAGISSNFRIDLVLNAMVIASMKTGRLLAISPKTRRCILFIEDLCFAISKIIEIQPIGTFNVGSLNTQVGDLAEIVRLRLGGKIDYVRDRSRSPFDFHLNLDKLSDTIGEYRSISAEKVITNIVERYDAVSISRANRQGPHRMLGMFQQES